MTRISDQNNQQNKNWMEWHHKLLSTINMNMAILSQFRAKLYNRLQSCFFIVKFLWCSNKLMKKKYFYKTFYLWNYPSESIFQKCCSDFFSIQGLNLSYSRPGHFGAISSICNRGPCAGLLLDGNMPACHRHFVLTLLEGRLQIIIANGKN